MRSEWKPQPNDDGTLSLESAVYQSVGAASVCWEPMDGTGVFAEQRARAIAEYLLRLVRSGGQT